MPRNKEALIRYRVINRCLIDYNIISKDKLIGACEDALDIHPLGKRTIDGDIHAMRYDNGLGYYAPIKYDRNRGGYYYEDPDYSIDNIPLNNEELEALVFTSSILDQFKNIDLFRQFSGAVQTIIDAVNIRRLKEETAMYDFIDFEKVPFVKGSEFLQPLIEAVKSKNTLTLTYQPFYEKEAYKAIIHPYLLKEYRNRWYVIGLNDENKELRTYALDRIHKIEKSNVSHIEQNFEPAEYFKNSIGIISPTSTPPTIKIAVKRQQAQYLITQPLHESQEIVEENKEEIIFKFKVHPTYEFKTIILGYGGDVRIIEPKDLKDEIINTLQNALEEYSKH